MKILYIIFIIFVYLIYIICINIITDHEIEMIENCDVIAISISNIFFEIQWIFVFRIFMLDWIQNDVW
jgi:hypothetical protein